MGTPPRTFATKRDAEIWLTKTEVENRHVPQADPALGTHLDELAQPGDDGLVFTGPGGQPLRRGNFRRRVWLPALSAAELPAIHFTICGTPATTLTANAGANLRELMTRMGHNSTRAALIYLHATDDRQRAITDSLDTLSGPN